MRTNTALMLVLVATSVVASSVAEARPRMRVFDANTGKTIFDDGKQDGKGCAVGSVATFNPNTGTFGTKPSVKCNFGNNQ